MMTRMGQQYGTVRQRALPGVSYVPAELGRGAHQTGDELLAALSVPSAGQLFDLDAGRWPGMPVLPVHPPFVMTTYRTPGRAVRTPDAATETGVTTELIVSSAHTGTHIDALCHVTEGSRWFGGGLDAEHLGDFGPTLAEASSIPPFLCRGVLLDVAALRGVEALPAGERITAEDLRAAADRQGVELRPGDAVLIRTGYMAVWGDDARRDAHYAAGPDTSAGRFLAESGAVVVGSDTENFECLPAASGEEFLPVHRHLLGEAGVHIIELLYLEQLARARLREFLFVCLSLRMRGATGSMVRPVAVA